ncbi:AraC family transcriptional regulator [Pseudomonas azerbaijanoccidens]|jgi:AraC-like DNA-binding protein|uniref:RCS-specific HTH-type transcriptional activator RclR n=1 Tax=Pseudomonas fluorescens TaxID=294 RepID=A0A5E7BXK1_PSEFL|nr:MULTISPECIES: AraC family transcriptional regulator [Pseudomonas]MCK8668487.1 AraC family transcriptional regulator [Pseudomonas azerbaijanoccidentalis]VVN96918.1 RCS-specific HTH-type transcriptional activator RclR [Pseudomonas fluorescens]
MDRLSTLLSHFGVNAGTFHSGAFCGTTAFDGSQTCGHLHLLQGGELSLKLADERELHLSEPTLIFFPRPYRHRLFAPETFNTQLVCASLDFDGGAGNALATALPDFMVLKLDEIPTMANTLQWLFDEAFAGTCGREAVMDRLFELVVILLLRHILSSRHQQPGMMAGLADPRLSRSLNLMHEAPGKPWSVAELSAAANMSRASFAEHFKRVVGQAPVDYLVSWRISLAQKRLREGKPIALIAEEVGYESPSALARAFRRKTGVSPREWRG